MRAILALIALVLAWTSVPAVAADPAQARFDAAAAQVRDHYMLADPQAAVAAAHRAEPLAQRIADPKARTVATATALWLQAEGLYRQDALESAAPLIARAYTLVRAAAPGSKLEADILLTRGTINGKQVRVAQALEDFQAAHRLFRANGDARREAISLICIANLYLDAKDYTAVLRYLGQALEAYHADAGLAQSIYNARGAVLKEQGKYESADAEFRQALGSARELKSTALQAMFLRNIAGNELKEGKVAEAEVSIAAARRLSTEGEDRTRLDALAAQAAFQKGELAEATRLIGLVFANLDLTTTDIRYRDAHLTAVAIYRATGRPDAALAHLLALKRLDDQITKLATETSSALMAARFDAANQEAKIARLKLEDDLQQARAQRTMTLFGAGATAVVVVLLLIFIGTIRRSRDQVRAANDDLAVTNTALGKALAAKTEFLATTSHEIRTPLNGILGMTQVMLADAGVAGAMRDRLGVVHGAGLTMRALVDDILDVAKMETGNLAIEQAPFDLPACLTEASAIWREQARDKGLAFSLDLARCPARVDGDAARVRQIVFNLLSNALKFTTAGSVSVVAEAAGEGIRIAVTDTGIGIAPDKQAEVFESFRQADASTTRRFGGTGLGLSICRSLAQAMGGEITLASRPGAGSTFTVILPLPVLAAVLPAAKAVTDGKTLLVVDRNPITRAMFRSLLAPHAGTVAFAGTADEAVARLGEGDVAQVLVDDGTARAGGDPHGFVRTLAAVGSTPIALLWPAAAGAEAQELLASGLAQVIAKPISGAALVRTLFATQGGADLQPALVSQAA